MIVAVFAELGKLTFIHFWIFIGKEQVPVRTNQALRLWLNSTICSNYNVKLYLASDLNPLKFGRTVEDVNHEPPALCHFNETHQINVRSNVIIVDVIPLSSSIIGKPLRATEITTPPLHSQLLGILR